LKGIDEDIADLAGQWARYSLVGLWPTLVFQVLRKYLQGCGIVWPATIANGINLFAVITGNYYAIEVLGWGFHSVALVTSLGQWLACLSLAIIIFFQISYLRYGLKSVFNLL
jgi:Na+-driven multidrug efflux pump